MVFWLFAADPLRSGGLHLARSRRWLGARLHHRLAGDRLERGLAAVEDEPSLGAGGAVNGAVREVGHAVGWVMEDIPSPGAADGAAARATDPVVGAAGERLEHRRKRGRAGIAAGAGDTDQWA